MYTALKHYDIFFGPAHSTVWKLMSIIHFTIALYVCQSM